MLSCLLAQMQTGGASCTHLRTPRACLHISFLHAHHPAAQILTPYNVYFNTKLIFRKGEVWRLLTNFFYFGNLGACWRGTVLGCKGVSGGGAPNGLLWLY